VGLNLDVLVSYVRIPFLGSPRRIRKAEKGWDCSSQFGVGVIVCAAGPQAGVGKVAHETLVKRSAANENGPVELDGASRVWTELRVRSRGEKGGHLYWWDVSRVV